MEEVGHAQTSGLSATHPATAPLTDDAQGLPSPVRLRQEAAGAVTAVPGRDTVLAAGPTPEAVRLAASDARLSSATGQPKAAPDRFHAPLRPDPPTVDAAP